MLKSGRAGRLLRGLSIDTIEKFSSISNSLGSNDKYVLFCRTRIDMGHNIFTQHLPMNRYRFIINGTV